MARENIRAGDGDRQAVADRLKAALDEGRLDLGEYDERLQRTYAAKTYGDLDGLLDDLPGTFGTEPSQVQAYQPAAAVPVPDAQRPPSTWARVAPGLGIFLACTLIWWATSDSGYFWPVWTLFPLLFAVLRLASGGDHPRTREARRDGREVRREARARRRDRRHGC